MAKTTANLRYQVILSEEMTQKWEFNFEIFIPSIADALSGFWLNAAQEFTRGEDCVIWVAPAQIMFVKKIKNDKN